MVGLCDGIPIVGHEATGFFGQCRPIGDLNNDNRDEVAISAYYQDMEIIDRASFGYLGRHTRNHTSNDRYRSAARQQLLGIHDDRWERVDGDGLPDIVTGYPDYRVSGDSVGALWLIPGSYIASMESTLVTGGLTPSTATVHPHLPNDDLNYGLYGEASGADFGYSLGLVASPNERNTHWVVSGSRYGHSDGGLGGGAAYVHRWEPGVGFETNPRVIFATEADAYNAQLGTKVIGHPEEPVIAIGSLFSHEIGFGQGAAYAVRLTSTETR